MGPVWQNQIQRTVRTAHLVCLWLCTVSVHNTTQNSSDNLPSYLQTNITAQMLSIRGEGACVAWYLVSYYHCDVTMSCHVMSSRHRCFATVGCMDESVTSNTFCLSRCVAGYHPIDQSTGRHCPSIWQSPCLPTKAVDCWLISSLWSPWQLGTRRGKYVSLPNTEAASTVGIQWSENIYYLVRNAIKFNNFSDWFMVNTVESLLKVGEVNYYRFLELLALFQDIS